ncbi:unnamed protein product [Urochloa decumbens]|uniref:Uncharacterized protein n=1 Tax=Urochloa decumbens TaxID=240449 RepID=A0ABC9C2M3_9POAL
MNPIVLLILGFVSMTAAQPWQICGTSGNYTANSAYQANLKTLSSILFDTDADATSLFSKGSIGMALDTVYGVALCRGDVNASACRTCIAAAFRGVQRLCALSKDATVFYDTCVLRFSDKDIYDMSFASRLNTSAVVEGALVLMNITSEPMLPSWDTNNQSTTANITSLFKTMLSDTLAQVFSTAKHYAAIQVDAEDGTFTLPRLYSMVQCAPDMIEDICYNCLNNFSELAMANFAGRQGGRVLGLRCNLRYHTSKFYAGEPTWSSGSSSDIVPNQPPSPNYKSSQPPSPNHKSEMNALEDEALIWGPEGRSSEFTIYDFSQVLEATGNFSEENKLGQGGFGPVYKGRFPDGLEIAVKRLAAHSGQGLIEFKNEIQLIAKLQHTNLVRLYGCCYQGQEKILVYEYLPNKSLDFFIFDEERRALIDWNKRLEIIDGIAQGLLYLHKHSRLRIIHRDLKAGNILLDCEMNPKISDFGLAKIFSTNDNEGNTNRIVGTYGYMVPEYASEGLFSIKSDVFSFGVLTLEIISGKRATSFHRYGDFINLLGHAWQMWKDDKWIQLVDTSLVTVSHTVQMIRCINIALLCVQENAADRPNMSEVVAMLSSESITLPEPKQPAFFHMRVTTEETSTVVVSSVNSITLSAVEGR